MKTVLKLTNSLLCFSVFLFTLVDCDKKDLDKIMIPVIIEQGNLYGGGEEGLVKQNIVITNLSEWNALTQKMNIVNESLSINTDIDFNKYQVIAVFDEIKHNDGWSIDITEVREYDDNIIVSIYNLKKGDLTTVITQPYQIVKVPTSNKKITF